MKFIRLINLKLLTIAISFLLNIAEHENFSANKYENAIAELSMNSFITSKPDPGQPVIPIPKFEQCYLTTSLCVQVVTNNVDPVQTAPIYV